MRWFPCSLLAVLGVAWAFQGGLDVLGGAALVIAALLLWVWLGSRYLRLALRGEYDAAQRAARWVMRPDARLWVRSLAGDDSVGTDLSALLTGRAPGFRRATAQALYASWLALHGEVAAATHHAADAVRQGYSLAYLVLAQLKLREGHGCPAMRAGIYLAMADHKVDRFGGPSLRAFPLALLAWAHALEGDDGQAIEAEEEALSQVGTREPALRAAVDWCLGHARLARGERAAAQRYWETGSGIDLGAWGQACRDEVQRLEG